MTNEKLTRDEKISAHETPAGYPVLGASPQVTDEQIVAGALFDLMAWLTTRTEVLELSSSHDAAPAVDVLKTFAEMHDLNIDNPLSAEWRQRLFAPPAAEMAKDDPSDDESLIACLDDDAALLQEGDPDIAETLRQAAKRIEEMGNHIHFLEAQREARDDLAFIDANPTPRQEAKPVAADETKDHYIGGRFVRYVRTPAGFSVECVSEYTVAVVATQKPGGVILADCPDCGSQVVVDSAAAPQEQAPADKDATKGGAA